MASPSEQQISDNYDLLLEATETMLQFSQDATQEPVDYVSLIREMDYDAVLTAARKSAGYNPSYSFAVVIDHAYDIQAHIREASMRMMSKRDYYSNAEFGYQREADFLSDKRTEAVNYVKGNTPVQGGV